MPENTPELAWWVMTGAIAGLLSLLTILVAIIGYLLKSGFEKLLVIIEQMADKIDAMQDAEAATKMQVAETRATCEERHRAIDRDIAEIKATAFCRRKNDAGELTA